MTVHNEIEWSPEQISRFWDYQASRTSAKQNYFSITRAPHIIKRTARKLSGMSEPRILDLGCGTGEFLKAFSRIRPDAALHGIDFSPKTIHSAEQNLASIHPTPELHAIANYPTPWADDTFDAIYSIEVVEHLSDSSLDSMFMEIGRVMKPSGILVITTPNSENLEESHTCCPNCGSVFHIWQHLRSWTIPSLLEFAGNYGFSLVQAQTTLLDTTYVRMMAWFARTLGLSPKQPPHILAIFRKAPP